MSSGPPFSPFHLTSKWRVEGNPPPGKSWPDKSHAFQGLGIEIVAWVWSRPLKVLLSNNHAYETTHILSYSITPEANNMIRIARSMLNAWWEVTQQLCTTEIHSEQWSNPHGSSSKEPYVMIILLQWLLGVLSYGIGKGVKIGCHSHSFPKQKGVIITALALYWLSLSYEIDSVTWMDMSPLTITELPLCMPRWNNRSRDPESINQIFSYSGM